ncbi:MULTISPECIES: hypothetical protein [Cupriavidus]|uniref:Uncharacterized protein n=1 Tax=Cupriavidus pauculus TaxID=82633 RepID=A0A5P2H135_9BURK|nr:hypothetical protein [Cupriavidus pauculus]QET01652.1 hypothetical protein FOB72_06090 [Cupriavidus pauculus]
MTDSSHWRFNADVTWHTFSATVHQSVMAAEATNAFMRYEYLRAALYFGSACAEGYLNRSMRERLTVRCLAERTIRDELKRPGLGIKLRKWPANFCDQSTQLPADIIDLLDKAQKVRNENTHPKQADHSIYQDMDDVQPNDIVHALARMIVILNAARDRPFPYWLLGWNYVGLNGDPSHPFESNNLNGFIHSLRHLGFSFDNHGSDMTWEQREMTSITGYTALREALQKLPFDIEPRDSRFPTRPRLTRRWWDKSVINDESLAALS